jgi:hypothetical protein
MAGLLSSIQNASPAKLKKVDADGSSSAQAPPPPPPQAAEESGGGGGGGGMLDAIKAQKAKVLKRETSHNLLVTSPFLSQTLVLLLHLC